MRQKSGRIRNALVTCQALKSSLAELRNLLLHIEAGNNLASRTLCVTLRRILKDELPVAAQQRQLDFYSYLTGPDDTKLPYPLTVFEVTEHGTRIIPKCLPTGARRKKISYRIWRKELAFNSKADVFLLLQGEPNATKDLSREEFIDYVRNEMGAHFSRDISQEINQLDSFSMILGLKVTHRDGEESRQIGKSPHKFNYLSATAVTIAIELIQSFSVSEDKGEIQVVQH